MQKPGDSWEVLPLPMGSVPPYRTAFPANRRTGCVELLRRLVLTLALLSAAPTAFSAPPTVNGLFYGDGDNARYTPYQTSANGSILYSYLDVTTSRLYVALVVDQQSVNDNVCSPKADKAYTSSAGWTSHRSCKRLSDSEYASWTLQCAPGSPNSWTWQQAYGCAKTAGPPQSNWVSDSTCGPSSPASAWPPGVEMSSTTSFVTNINTYQNSTTHDWNLYQFGTDIDSGWKSPFIASSPEDVTQVPGYPTYSGFNYQWEWSMVYEWSVDLKNGTHCGDDPVYFVTGLSHHSPSKNGDMNDTFTPPDDPVISDWGDLPDDTNHHYGTLESNGGARHYITVNGPYLGVDMQAELDGVPTADATGDGTEEDGVTVNVTDNWTAGSTQTIEVKVSNVNTVSGNALLGAWFDWNNDGDFDDPGEFFTWSVGEGSNSLNITVGSSFDWQSNDLYARFRIFSSGSAAPGGSLTQADYIGTATDGEVEDYFYEAGALPVSLNAFSSSFTNAGLDVSWQTASETNNVGFELWGQVRGEWRLLSEFIASQDANSALPQTYKESVSARSEIEALALVHYDTHGHSEGYGPFVPGEIYGEVQQVEKIDWSVPRSHRNARLKERGFFRFNGNGSSPDNDRTQGKQNHFAADFSDRGRWRKLKLQHQTKAANTKRSKKGVEAVSPGSSQVVNVAGSDAIVVHTGALTHIEVREAGIQRVSYEALRAGGLDLAGVRDDAIAVTWRGEPVARWIGGGGSVFGPGRWIDFIGRAPRGDDALYIDANLYQVAVDPARARAAGSLGKGAARDISSSYQKLVLVDRPQIYYSQSPTGDPWVERTVLTRGGGSSTVTLEIPVAGPVVDGPASLFVGLGAITDLPDKSGSDGILPEHNVEVLLKGPGADAEFVPVTTASISGQQDWEVEASLPSGFVEPGTYQLKLRFETAYAFSLVVVDRYGMRYAAPYRGPTLDFAPDRGADGYRVEGFTSRSIVAYGEGEDGSLTRMEPRVEGSGGGYAAELRQIDAARLWVDESPRTPQVFTTEAPGDLLAEPGDLVVIADSSFIGTPALEDYVQSKAAFSPVVVDIEDIYNSVGYGMALPGAITDYLKARNERYPFTHVQLVGTDCYDRLNYISDCISFIPLPTARVGVNIYSPSQNRLVDLDDDGIGDKAVGQFSVRDESELATIVQKGVDWRNNVAGLQTALLIAEESDGVNDFKAQIDRLNERLDWSGAEVLDMADHSAIGTARQAFGAALESGRTLTIFSGHSSPSVWAYRSLVTAGTVETLANAGLPTAMVPLACEATYDISPQANVLGHQLLYGGDRGAVAISGAVSLSSLKDNERMANHVIDGLKSGLTLGEAVQNGRDELGAAFQPLQDNWITQGDVTLRLAQ